MTEADGATEPPRPPSGAHVANPERWQLASASHSHASEHDTQYLHCRGPRHNLPSSHILSASTPCSRRRVPPLFAEPDAYFRSSYPTLARQPKPEPLALQNPRLERDSDRSLRSPTKGKSSHERQPHGAPVVRHSTWEAIPLRSWPTYQVEESRSPSKRDKVYVRPATATVQRNASMASPKSANWRPSSSSHRPRSPYDMSYTRDHKLATTSLKALRRDLTDLLTKVDTLESHEILSKTSAVKQRARSVAVASQPTPLMGNVELERDDMLAEDAAASNDLSSRAPIAAGDDVDLAAKAGSTDGVGGRDESKRLDVHEAELDMLLVKFGLTSEQPSFRPALMHPPGYIYSPGDRRKLSLEHESENAGQSAGLADVGSVEDGRQPRGRALETLRCASSVGA